MKTGFRLRMGHLVCYGWPVKFSAAGLQQGEPGQVLLVLILEPIL